MVSQHSIPYILINNSQIKLEFVTNGYFKEPFQDPEPKLKYSENKIFVTSHFGTLLELDNMDFVG